MVFEIFLNGESVNRLVSSDVSFVDDYCAKNGYTYARVYDTIKEDDLPTDHEILMTFLGVTE